MTTDDADRRLDGNAAAGLLAEVFCLEMTLAHAAGAGCAGCGRTGPVAELLRYGHEMGAILRCPNCDTPVIRIARTRGEHWLDLRGAVSVRTTGGVGANPEAMRSHGSLAPSAARRGPAGSASTVRHQAREEGQR